MLENASSMKVLLLSADARNAQMVSEYLVAAGFRQITKMDDGVQAVKGLSTQPQDLVLIDMNVKFLSGWLLVKEVKTSEKVPNTPVVLFGSVPSPAAKDELQRFGVNDFFSLPGTQNSFQFLLNSTISIFKTSGTTEAAYTKAKKALIAEETDKAIEIYGELRGRTSKDLRSSVGLVQAYVQNEQLDKANEVLTDIDPKADGGSFAGILKLRMALTNKDMKAAQEITTMLLGLTPSSPYYYARCLKIANEFDAVDLAESIAEAGHAKEFPLPDFILTVAKCRFHKKKYEESFSAIQDAIFVFGPTGDALNLKGACLRKLNRVDEAIEAYEEALKLSPMDHKIFFNLAICANSLGRYQLAKEYLSSCIRIAPNAPRAQELLAEIVKNTEGK